MSCSGSFNDLRAATANTFCLAFSLTPSDLADTNMIQGLIKQMAELMCAWDTKYCMLFREGKLLKESLESKEKELEIMKNGKKANGRILELEQKVGDLERNNIEAKMEAKRLESELSALQHAVSVQKQQLQGFKDTFELKRNSVNEPDKFEIKISEISGVSRNIKAERLEPKIPALEQALLVKEREIQGLKKVDFELRMNLESEINKFEFEISEISSAYQHNNIPEADNVVTANNSIMEIEPASDPANGKVEQETVPIDSLSCAEKLVCASCGIHFCRCLNCKMVNLGVFDVTFTNTMKGFKYQGD